MRLRLVLIWGMSYIEQAELGEGGGLVEQALLLADPIVFDPREAEEVPTDAAAHCGESVEGAHVGAAEGCPSGDERAFDEPDDWDELQVGKGSVQLYAVHDHIYPSSV